MSSFGSLGDALAAYYRNKGSGSVPRSGPEPRREIDTHLATEADKIRRAIERLQCDRRSAVLRGDVAAIEEIDSAMADLEHRLLLEADPNR